MIKRKLVVHILGGVNSKNLIYTNKIDIDKELSKVNPVKALTSGQFTTSDIGKTVYLSNSATSCQEWRIADINHDGTSGTVDLFSKYLLGLSSGAMGFGTSQYYSNSSVRSCLTSTVYNGFTPNVQNALKVQNFSSNGSTLSDKVKCPSLTEVGCNNTKYAFYGNYALTEGNIYPIFGIMQQYPNSFAAMRSVNGSSGCYWTRTRYTDSSFYVWYVGLSGAIDFQRYNNGVCNIVACIRF